MIERKAMMICCFALLPALQKSASAQWFTEAFDTYFVGTCTSPFCGCTADNVAFDAVWAAGPGSINDLIESEFESGTCPTGRFIGYNLPFSWKMHKGLPVKAARSLIPAIQAASDPSKNAVNGTAASPLVIHFHMWLNTVGKQNQTSCWLELFSGPIPAMNAPIKAPGVGTCTGGFCVGGPMDGRACTTDDTCTPMKLERTGTTGDCVILNSSPSVPKPAIAYGVFAGDNGLVPKPPCANLVNNGLSHPVIYDGDKWWQMKVGSPPSSLGGDFLNGQRDNDITLTITDTTIAVTAIAQPEPLALCALNDGTCANNDGTCADNDGTCDLGTNTCTGGVNAGQSCVDDSACLDTHLCTGGIHAGQSCVDDTACLDTHLCVGGIHANQACNVSDPDCRDTHTCTSGPNQGLPCSANGNCRPIVTYTKTNIQRDYTGPFQTIAMGPGTINDTTHDYTGSLYPVQMDNIEISGGEFSAAATGACCDPADSSCIDDVMEAACLQQVGHQYAGDGVTCALAPCGSGACCLETGTCIETDPASCSAQSGTFAGFVTHCDDANLVCCPHGQYLWADKDTDGDVDLRDFAEFQLCYTGTGGGVPDGCECYDRATGSPAGIDIDDFTAFENCATGPTVSYDAQNPPPGCVP